MNKKLLIMIGIVFLSSNVFASEEFVMNKELIKKRNLELLAKNGIFFPKYNEVNIVPIDTYLNYKKNKNDQNDIHLANKMKEYLAMYQEQNSNGFVNELEPRAKELLNLKEVVPHQIEKYKNNLSPESTHFRKSIDELKLGYTFVGVPNEDITTNIGFVPFGAYKSIKNGDLADGWDGAGQFFEKDGIGTCAFTEHNRQLSQCGVELIKEFVTYDINNKPTIILIKGNKFSGYVYKIEWFDSMFSRELECANEEFNINIRSNVISLANRIDNKQ